VQTGCRLEVNQQLVLGDRSTNLNTYDLGGDGTVIVHGPEAVGAAGGRGMFTQTSGLHDVKGQFYVGNGVGQKVSTYQLSGGTLTVAMGESVGNGGTGVFNQSGGLHAVTGGLSIGSGNSLGPPGDADSGVYNLSGGTLSVGQSETLGGRWSWGRPATFHQTGGIHTIGGNLGIGGYSHTTANYQISSGSLSVAGNLTLGSSQYSSAFAGLEIDGAASDVRVQGNLVIASGSTQSPNQMSRLTVQLAPDGLTAISVGGTATLHGALDVELMDGFTPFPGQQFDVLTASSGITNSLSLIGSHAADFQLATAGSTLVLTYSVPEPSTFILLGMGAIGLLAFAYRGRRQPA
jgi:hypothetical protein